MTLEEYQMQSLMNQLEAGFLISSYFRTRIDNFPVVIFVLQSNEWKLNEIPVKEGRLVQEFLASDEFPKHLRKLEEKAAFLIDLREFSELSADEQLDLLVRYQTELNKALAGFAVQHRISTGDGTIVVLDSDQMSHLFECLWAVEHELAGYNQDFGHDANPIRFKIGVNIGLCFDFRDVNGQWNVVGPGINDAQRVSQFAAEYEILVSRAVKERYDRGEIRSPAEVRIVFEDEQSGTDKHGREHFFRKLLFGTAA
jgi:class 3 adenylate cyclase